MSDLDVRITRLTPNNQRWLHDYVSTQKTGKANLLSALVELMEMHQGDISTISFQEIKTFLELVSDKNTDITVNGKADKFRRFFQYISTTHGVSFSFDTQELKDLRIKNVQIKREAKPLRLSELARIRRMILDDDIRRFVFEMAYRYGCTLEDLSQMSVKRYDADKRIFNFRRRTIQIEEDLHDMILRNPKILLSRTQETYSEYFRLLSDRANQAGILSDRGLMWSDIKITREHYLLRCAECEDLYENKAGHWVLASFSYDPYQTKWLVCKKCGEKGINYG